MSAADLEKLTRTVVRCNRCPRLRQYCAEVARTRVARFRHQEYWGKPVPGFGDANARLLIVGLAPAAHGANRTGRMFTGDSSGDWLYEALHRFGFASQPTSTARDDGLALIECWIAASARCAPPDNKPMPAELVACRRFLVRELELLSRVEVIVTLGGIAHDSYLRAAGWWEHYAAGERPRFAHGAEYLLPSGQRLLASYHPSRQNTNTGRLTRPMWHDIYRRARAILETIDAAPVVPERGRPE